VSDTIINSGGVQGVVGGITKITTINKGASQYVRADGVAIDTIIHDGGKQMIRDISSLSINTTVCKGGTLDIENGAVAKKLKVKSGGKVVNHDVDTDLQLPVFFSPPF
jgi:antigen 43